MLDPAPTNLKIAQPPVPVGIYPMACTHRHNRHAPADQVQSCSSQDQSQARKGLSIKDFARLQLKASRFVIQEILLDVEAQTEFIQRSQTGRLITLDGPFFEPIGRLHMSQGQVTRTEPAVCDPDHVQEERFPFGGHPRSDFHSRLIDSLDPEGASQADAKTPTQVTGQTEQATVEKPRSARKITEQRAGRTALAASKIEQ